MHLTRSLASLNHVHPSRVLAIGAFDGLHLGHQEILRQTLSIAAERSELATAFTFEPTPAEFFTPNTPPARLTCFRERFELLEDLGMPALFCPHFGTLSRFEHAEFVAQVLVAKLKVGHVVVGHDFRFGAGRRGTLEDLRGAGERFGFGVTTIDPVFMDGKRISSTAIRAALAKGDLRLAKEMLGRDYSMSGRVVHGLNLGRELGFPTANVNLKRRLSPVDGIFAVRVTGLESHPLDGVASVGSRPTVSGGEILLEVFLFDFDRDIYGEYITVTFVERLREERTFHDLEALKQQMHVDVRDAQAALAG